MDISSSLSINSCLNLDSLPLDIYFYFFNYLDIDDILKLKLISKKFCSIVNSYKFKELSLIKFKNSNLFEFKKNWFSTNKSTRSNRIFYLTNLTFFIRPLDNFLNLKYLRIYNICSFSIKFSDLNKLSKLQILEINYIRVESDDHLKLDYLEAFSIRYIYNYKQISCLQIDTPMLHSLLFMPYETIAYKHPNSIKYLCLPNLLRDLNISIFSSLEVLEIEIFSFSRDFSTIKSYVSKLNNLNKLRFNHLLALITKEEILNKLQDLWGLKKDLEIFISGVQIKEVPEFRNYYNDPTQFQMDNYNKLETDLNFVYYIEYHSLMDLLPSNQPSDLFSKFNNIGQVDIKGEIKDENRLINFIKGCHNLYYLEVDSPLSQEFYNQLPSVSLLFILHLKKRSIDLDFQFIMKMSYLTIFMSEFDFLINQNIRLTDLKYLKKILTVVKDFKFYFEKESSRDRYLGRKMRGPTEKIIEEYKNLNLNEIIKLFNSLRETGTL